ncbi:MAG: MltA domain-containing protein [Planctomycetota bacterium]|nr:MltA domain-containing protein [Planctomycetota bacterium]
MRQITTLALAGTLALLAACSSTKPDYSKELPEGAPALLPLGPNEKRPDFQADFAQRDEILPALEQSIAWTKKKTSAKWFPIEGVSSARALASLERFRDLLTTSKTAEEFDRRIGDDFTVYKSAGWNGQGGGVLFTAYCTPILAGSPVATAEYRYPLYALPPDLVKGSEGEILGQKVGNATQPYPVRRVIEATGMLEKKNLELAWLADPVDAYIAHVNGSAFIRQPDGEMLKLGYAGKNGREYASLGKALIDAKELPKDGVNLAAIRAWAKKNPAKVQEFLNKNDSFVFFQPIEGNPHGSLNVPVTGNRSIATDKRLFPRGALTWAEGHAGTDYGVELGRFLFDQDTGGAIRTAGRADVYVGVGDEAEKIAGATRQEGQLYYLFLKEGSAPQP